MEELLNSPRNWTEDFPHENGNYMCNCTVCKNRFMGYKRRTVCKMCFTTESGDYYCKPCNKKVEKSCGKEPHCAAYSPLPNCLPDDEMICDEARINSHTEPLVSQFPDDALQVGFIVGAKWMRSLAEKASRQDAIDFMNWREEKYVLCDKEMYHEKGKSENLKLHTSALYALFITEKYRESCK